MPQVPCTNKTCTGQVCCVHYQDENQDKCAPKGNCGSGFVEAECDGPADCLPGQICCGHWGQYNWYSEIVCAPDCPSSRQNPAFVMCAGAPNVCPPGTSCQDSHSLPDGFMVCRN
ncbi:MAG: hypothetical protein HY744_09605 [Deltaproteobacteria bacterium]|nr:hypothetical protein [Deltaproteobacteria bacterium]